MRSTPSSEALDVVADLRYESLRFRSLPLASSTTKNDHGTTSFAAKETNGNLFDQIVAQHTALETVPEPIPLGDGLKQYPMLNGNANTTPVTQNIEDLYAKVSKMDLLKQEKEVHLNVNKGGSKKIFWQFSL